jgi:hypothetical protein
VAERGKKTEQRNAEPDTSKSGEEETNETHGMGLS